MHNKKLLILCVFLVLLSILTSCKTEEEESNPFIGTWSGYWSSRFTKLVFTETTFTVYIDNEYRTSHNYTWSGNTFTSVDGSSFGTLSNSVLYAYNSSDMALYKQ